MFNKILSKTNAQDVLKQLFQDWEPGKNINCPFAENKHTNGTDNSKSMSISIDGKVFCHACGYKATNVINFWIDLHGYTFKEGIKYFYNEFFEALVPDEYVESAHKALLNNLRAQQDLLKLRLINKRTITAYKLGFSFDRLIIPIYNEFGFIVNTRNYDLYKKSSIKILPYAKGFGKARLFPLASLHKQQIYIFEGEMDTLLALQLGINAITLTSGALVWPKEINMLFTDKDIIIVPDVDKPGIEGAYKKAEALKFIAKSVSIVKLPLTGEKNDKDFTDFIKKGKTITHFLALPTEKVSNTTTTQLDKVPTQIQVQELDLLPSPAEQLNLERASKVFDYLKNNGAFFKNALGILFYAQKNGAIFRVSLHDTHFLSFLSNISPLLNTTTTSGKFVIQHIINKAQQLCTLSKTGFWSLIDNKDNLFVIAQEGKLLKVQKGKCSIIQNGINEENVLLETPTNALPVLAIKSQATANAHAEAINLLWSTVLDNIAISNENKYLLICWVLGVFFRDLFKNKPLMRLSASTAFGKSTASKLLSILFYGEEIMHHSASTIASMYSLATEYPLLILDNLETRNMIQPLEDFLIVAATGGLKSKRTLSTNTSVTFEHINSLILTNGIEPFSKHEILNRTIELPLNIDRFGKTHFHETKIVTNLKENRAKILHTLLYLVSHKILPRLKTNEAQRIAKCFNAHSKERFNEYIGLMAIILDSLWPYKPLKNYALPHNLVNYWLDSQNKTAESADAGTNDIVYFLDTYLKRSDKLLDTTIVVQKQNNVCTFTCTIKDLLSDFRLLAKNLGIKCPWQNERQLGVRIADASEILTKVGWYRKQKIRAGRRYYEFAKKIN